MNTTLAIAIIAVALGVVIAFVVIEPTMTALAVVIVSPASDVMEQQHHKKSIKNYF